MALFPQDKALASLKGFLQSGAYSDLNITCGSNTYKVHKIVVCERVSFFARALEFGGQETQDNVIKLADDEPEIIKLLIQYIYESEYEPQLPEHDTSIEKPPNVPTRPRLTRNAQGVCYTYELPHTCWLLNGYCLKPTICPHHTCAASLFTNTGACNFKCSGFQCRECNPFPPTLSQLPTITGTSDQLLVHAKMYEIADKYDVPGLKDLVIEKFRRACRQGWDCAKFPIAAHYVFSTTPDEDKGLRNVVASTIASHMKELVKKPEIESLLKEFSSLSYGLLKAKIESGWQ